MQLFHYFWILSDFSIGDISSFANSFPSTQWGGGKKRKKRRKAFCLGENLMCSAGALSCKAILPRPRELLEVPMAASLLCALGAWGCSPPGVGNAVMLCHVCRSNAGGFPGLKSPRTSASKPPPCPKINVFKKKKTQKFKKYCKEYVQHLFWLVVSFQPRKPPLAKFQWPRCGQWINVPPPWMTYPGKQAFLWEAGLFGWNFAIFGPGPKDCYLKI